MEELLDFVVLHFHANSCQLTTKLQVMSNFFGRMEIIKITVTQNKGLHRKMFKGTLLKSAFVVSK